MARMQPRMADDPIELDALDAAAGRAARKAGHTRPLTDGPVKQVLRNSYLSQLLAGAKSWEVAREIEKQWDVVERQDQVSYFAAMHGPKDDPAVLHRLTQAPAPVSTSEVRQRGAASLVPSGYLCCTVEEIALVAMGSSQDRPVSFLWKKKYTDVERIFRCYGSQAIVFVFKDGRSSRLSKLAFYRDDVRDEVIAHVERMRADVGEGSGDGFQFVINATGMKKEIKNHVEDAKVVAATITGGGPEQPGETMLWTLSVPVTCLMNQPLDDESHRRGRAKAKTRKRY
ncbi:unnamed protein product [Prorocentrum cordatum]|uniref:RNA-directed RNA polymerase n=1 Tax=Prorocentrum cordatum TaxID=2364126 RepID=A0ABN9S609_9DINO|nr:unnamed protein product [Polarella glacialis]